MLVWRKEASTVLLEVAQTDPELVVRIKREAFMLVLNPAIGELMLGDRAYKDPEGRFRIAYVVMKKGIEIIHLKLID